MSQTEGLSQFSQLLQQLVQQVVTEQVEPLREKIRQLEASQDEWVDTREALRLTGIKQGETLKAERERANTLLVVKFEGKTNKTPRYLRSSLLAYNESKVQSPTRAGRNLAA